MDCRTAKELVPRFIAHDLSGKELEDFLFHIDSCKSCREELETNYILQSVIRHLDADTRDSQMDFQSLLDEDIERSRTKVRRMHFRRTLGYIAIFAGLCAAAAVSLYFWGI